MRYVGYSFLSPIQQPAVGTSEAVKLSKASSIDDVERVEHHSRQQMRTDVSILTYHRRTTRCAGSMAEHDWTA
jgi:hypothetical protein